MTSTPPPEQQTSAVENNNTNSLTREDTANEGYTGFDPSSGLYYYTNGVDQTMFYDGFNNQWLYWNNEGQFYYPVGKDASPPSSSAAPEEGKEQETATTTPAIIPSATARGEPRKIPDEDKRPLPFRLTSSIQSERERLLGKSGNHAKKRIDWGAALDNYSVRGGAGLGHFSNPPILPPRFYYPHAVAGSYYDFLNVRPNASVEEIEESVQWWELVGYPKAAEADPDRAERIHRLIMEAALIITNSSLRAQYDQTLPLGGKGKGATSSSSQKGMLDVSNYVPRVLHFHQGEGEQQQSGYGSRSSSRPGSVTSTPSKYPGKPTPGGQSTNTEDSSSSIITGSTANQALLEEDLSQPSITERLFAAVSEGIFGPPRTKPRNKRYAAKGMEWIEDERRRMGSSSADGSSEMYNGEAAAPNSGFKVTNTTTNQSKHTDPASTSSAAAGGAVKPPL